MRVVNRFGHASRIASIAHGRNQGGCVRVHREMLDDCAILLKIDADEHDSFKRVECRRDLSSAAIARHPNDLERGDLNGCGSVRC